ncbi:MAG: TatD family hydrolase [Geminicoccaceae bacterium]|nr:TatD family hydrolase [Geminicoccaceae bacterium]
MLVDSHCHLDFPGLKEDLQGVLARARRAGVQTMLTISTRLSTFQDTLALVADDPDLWCSTGVHPHQSGEEGPDSPDPLIANAAHPKVIAVGEAGLDYHYDYGPRDAQAKGFRAHIQACQRTGLPLVVHTREADADTMAILGEGLAKAPFTGVIHCYSSSPELGRWAIDHGFHLGIGGVLTFKRSDELRATVAGVPRERILLETDSPYLAPVPKRGKTNEPAYVAYVAGVLAEVWGVDVEEVGRVTTGNFFGLFRKAL